MIDERLNRFRLDIDEVMGERAVAIWKAIEGDLNGNGPFAQMLLAFRDDAERALRGLIYAEPTNAVGIAALQAEVQRSLRTMERIEEFKGAAEAERANEDNDQSDEEVQPVVTNEE